MLFLMRIGFVIQRYGSEVNGGGEQHCRWLAERLAARHHVEVFTTCALDYLTWANHFAPGTSEVNAIRVHRFPVRRQRSFKAFRDLSNLVFHEDHSEADEDEWFRLNGPESPKLLAAIERAAGRFDWLVFYSFRYYQSYFGLPRVRDKAILVPTAEEDHAVDLAASRRLFRLPRGHLFLTPEEKELVEEAAGTALESEVIGSGVNLVPESELFDFRAKHGLGEFLLYVGRVDKNKGCKRLFDYYGRFVKRRPDAPPLVLLGKSVINIPRDPLVRHLGFVTEAEKFSALRQCTALVMPSAYESLSVIVLEAWAMGRAVLANAQCKVLEGQCRRSNGGLYYRGYSEFEEAYELLLARPDLREALGRQGRDYFERNYRWPILEAKVESLLGRLGQG
jgi:glycosyltransferase involved in cell wall biosynthesis